MHIFIPQKVFDTLFDTLFLQGLMRQKCLNMGLYDAFKEILRTFLFSLTYILTQILLQEYLYSLYAVIGIKIAEKCIADLCQLLLQMTLSNHKNH